MRTTRLAVPVAVLLAVSGLNAASAAARKPTCLLVVDAAGDGTTADVVSNRDSLDVLSADVATGKRNLVAVVRLASAQADPTLTPGVTYRFTWRAGLVDQGVTTVVYTDGTRVAVFDPDLGNNSAADARDVAFDMNQATNSLVWTVSRKLNPALGKKGVKLSAFSVRADPAVNLSTRGYGVNWTSTLDSKWGDSATSTKTYLDLAPSCVKGV